MPGRAEEAGYKHAAAHFKQCCRRDCRRDRHRECTIAYNELCVMPTDAADSAREARASDATRMFLPATLVSS